MAAGNKDNVRWNVSSPLFIVGAVLLVVSLVFFLLIPSVDVAVKGLIPALSPLIWALMNVITFFGSLTALALMTVVMLIVLFLKGRKRDMLFYGVATVSAGIVDLILKYSILRSRPSDLLELTPAYPSGHSLGSMVIFGGIALILMHQVLKSNRSICPSLLIFLVPLLVGLSRLFLRVHWLSDVLAGWGIGLLVLWLTGPLLDFNSLGDKAG
jgi:membrane-associated phospholipid phosphatase